VLGRPQIKIPDSEVPIPAAAARRDLHKLLAANVPQFRIPENDMEMVYKGWGALSEAFGPRFVEKSPHHLHEWSALELMLDAERQLPHLDFRYVGLVRNPMDALYSMWNRRRDSMAKYQFHWRIAYDNLSRFQKIAQDRLLVVRYEDLNAASGGVDRLFTFLGVQATDAARKFVHTQSRSKWKSDRWFGLTLDAEAQQLAQYFGYQPEEMENETFALWPAYRSIARLDPRYWAARWRNVRRTLRNVF
jgi:hypothetical protein